MIVLPKICLEKLTSSKNLLAFSHGTDSTALFYILQANNIKFDIVMMDYNLRAQSKDEVAAATKLAKKFNKEIYLKSVFLNHSNFEANARQARYEFFAEICQKYGYENLILAHQLNDKFEWFLMQLSRGAGLESLLGMDYINKGDKFDIIRPLLGVSKTEILNFLHENKLKFFLDESNGDEKYFRNYIRANFSDKFLDKFSVGVARSFEFLQKDAKNLKAKILQIDKNFYAVKADDNFMSGLDKVSKKLGLLTSRAQKIELQRCLQNDSECVLGGKVAFGRWRDFILVSIFCNDKMDKNDKEKFRKIALPKHIRPYLAKIKFDLSKLEKLK